METIGPEKLLFDLIPILEKVGIKYFITGGLAVSVWGRPRATFDIDIVVQMVSPQLKPLAQALKKMSSAGYLDEETALDAINNKGEFSFIDSDTGFKIDFWVLKEGKETDIAYGRRITKVIGKQKIYFISPEDLVVNKLLWHRESDSSRHLEDIESIIKISKNIDLTYIKKRIKDGESLNVFLGLLNKNK